MSKVAVPGELAGKKDLKGGLAPSTSDGHAAVKPEIPAVNVSSASSLADPSKIVDEALKAAPGPSEGAIEAAKARQQAQASDQAPEPVKRKRGNPGGTRGSYGPRAGSTASTLNTVDAKSATEEGFRKTGREIADTILLVCVTVGGEDWKPKQVIQDGVLMYDEQANIQKAWEAMALKYQWTELPAWVGVAIVMGSYALPRINAPSTVSRTEKLKLWWKARQIKKADEKAKAEAAGA